MILCAGFFGVNANAGGIIYQFDDSFSGGVPTGISPWVTATLQNTSGGVLLTVNNSGLTSGEFLGSLYLNINPADSSQIPNLTFSQQSSSAGVAAPTIQTGEDGFKADGDGKYDILFSFATANAGQFGAGEQMTYLISGIPGLTANDFAFLSTSAGGEHGPFDAAGHIQGIGANGDSAWVDPSLGAIVIPVPEPSPAAIFVIAVGLLGGTRLWLRRSRA
jgi:hypothetical protein